MRSISEKELPTQNHIDSRKNFARYTPYSDTVAQTTTSTPTWPACGRIAISVLRDLSWYINNIYRTGHFVTPKQTDDTYHVYREIYVGHIPEVQYNLDREHFEPRDIHITTKLLEQALEEYNFLNTFTEDLETPEHDSSDEENFVTPPQSPTPETPWPSIEELLPEPSLLLEPVKEKPLETSITESPLVESIPRHRTLKPTKSALKVRFQQWRIPTWQWPLHRQNQNP